MQPPPLSPSAPGMTAFLRAATAVWLTVLCPAALVVGGHDLLYGRDVSARLLGFVMFLAGVVCVIGAAGVARQWTHSRLAATLACIWSAVLGLALAGTQLATGDPDATLVLWGVMIIGSLALAVVLPTWASARDRKIFWRGLPALGSIVSLGVLVSAGQFWYSSIYLPAAAPPSLTVSANLQQAARHDGRIALRGTITITNSSGTRVNLVGSAVCVVAGESQRAVSGRFKVTPNADNTTAGCGRPVRQRYEQVVRESVVLISRVVPDGTYLQTGETASLPVTAYVPVKRYDIAYLRADLFFTRGTVAVDWDHERKTAVTLHNGSRGSRDVTPVFPTGWINELTRRRRSLVTTWAVDPRTGEGGVDVKFDLGDDRRNTRIERSLGFASTNVSAHALLGSR